MTRWSSPYNLRTLR